jgi:pseudouridine synthase
MNDTRAIRLNKFISDSGFCSRREADRLIADGWVALNGHPAEVGTKVLPGDRVTVKGQPIQASAEDKTDRTYIAYHKPVGITCTTLNTVKGNIVDAIGHPERIFPIGRLDKPSEGLIFLTSDGDIVNKILRAENAHDKEYIVTVDRPLDARFVERMSSGIPILNTVTKPCRVSIQSRYVFKIILTQGLNRQIRRMCEYLGYRVTRLIRTRIMNVSLGSLKPGQWRNLTAAEMAEINRAVAGSRKTASEPAMKKPQTVQPSKPPVGAKRSAEVKKAGAHPHKPVKSSKSSKPGGLSTTASKKRPAKSLPKRPRPVSRDKSR